jgi:hypothetical protein
LPKGTASPTHLARVPEYLFHLGSCGTHRLMSLIRGNLQQYRRLFRSRGVCFIRKNINAGEIESASCTTCIAQRTISQRSLGTQLPGFKAASPQTCAGTPPRVPRTRTHALLPLRCFIYPLHWRLWPGHNIESTPPCSMVTLPGILYAR